tara:strand:- start:91 stop:351 length:261 start_codon:yes stop_codon:yes gene_type:complete
MADNIIFALVGLFIAVAILIGISTMILGSTVSDCEGLPGYDVNGSSGWALSCEDTNQQTQNAFSLLTIILVVVAAITILVIIRLLG